MSQGQRILLVEDDSSVREFLSLALTDEGYCVFTAENGWVGITQLASFQPHLIILDMNLPILDGQDFISIHKGLPDAAPVIGISAMRNAKELATRLGVADFLEKPFELDELFGRITQCLSELPNQNDDLGYLPPSRSNLPLL